MTFGYRDNLNTE